MERGGHRARVARFPDKGLIGGGERKQSPALGVGRRERPSLEPEPTDDWAEEENDSSQYALKSKHTAVQESAPAVDESESVLVEILPEGPSIDSGKFRYGYDHPWNVVVFETQESATRFKNYTAVFARTDRRILTEGCHILVEAMDWQGNINSVEKGGAIEKN